MSSFFQKIGSLVSSAVGSKSKIPYDIEDTEIGKSGFWSIRKAERDDKKFSAFVFDKVKNKNHLEESLAQEEVKRLRTLRHPGIVHYVFHHENEEQIVMVTEALTLLNLKEETEISKLFGCYSILKALSFLHSNHMYHYHINPDAVFVDQRKMWKLGAVGCLTKIEDPYSTPTDFPIHKFSQVILKRYPLYRSPELNQKKWQLLVRYPHATDIFSYGVLLFDVFEGAQIDHVEQITRSALRSLPKSLRRNAMRLLLNSNPSKRPSTQQLIENPAFRNEIFNLFEFVDRVTIEQDPNVLESNLTKLWGNLDRFPTLYKINRILPQLFHALLYGAGQLRKKAVAAAGDSGARKSFSPENQVTPQLKMYQIIFRIGSEIEDSEVYQRIVIPPLYKILCSTDTMPIYHQIKVVEQIGQIVPHAEPKFLKTKIFPILMSGLNQSRSTNLQEACVKSVVPLIPIADTQQQLINILIPTFFNLLKCPKKSVRANAVIAVGMMTPKLAEKSKSIDEDLLDLFSLPFFARTLKNDNFSYSKIYTLKALKTTMNVYNFVQLCRSVIPIVSPWLISRNSEIRDGAYDCFKESTQRIRRVCDGGEVENELNRILGVQHVPRSTNPNTASQGSSSSQNPSSVESNSGKTGRIKNWASTLFLGKQAVEEEAKAKESKKKREEEQRIRLKKRIQGERRWAEDRKRREMEELKKLEERSGGKAMTIGRGGRAGTRTHTNQGRPIPAVIMGGGGGGGGEEEEDDSEEDRYVIDFLKGKDSPKTYGRGSKRGGSINNIGKKNNKRNKKSSKKSNSTFFPDLDDPDFEFDRAKDYNQDHSKKGKEPASEDWEIGWGEFDDGTKKKKKNSKPKKEEEEDTDDGDDENMVDWGEDVNWDDDDEIEVKHDLGKKPVKKKKNKKKIAVSNKKKKEIKKKPKRRDDDDDFEIDVGWGGFEDLDENDEDIKKGGGKTNNEDFNFWEKPSKNKKTSSGNGNNNNGSRMMGMGSGMIVDDDDDDDDDKNDEPKVMSADDFWSEDKHKKKKKDIENEFEGLIDFDDI